MNNFGGRVLSPTVPPTQQDKYWAAASHGGSFIIQLASGFGFIVPLVVYLAKKTRSHYIAENALQSLVFNLLTGLIMIVLGILGCVTCGLTWVLIPVVWALNLTYVIIATIRAYDGYIYEYPYISEIIGGFRK